LSLKKPIILGLFSTIILLGIYIIILTIANSFSHAIDQFIELWYWMVPLLIGFGLQIGLFVYSREALKKKKECSKTINVNNDNISPPVNQKVTTASVTATGGMSVTSMAACCAHHVVDVLPVLGFSAAAIFLVQYQVLFLVIGIVSNLIGINIMAHTITKHKLYYDDSIIFRRLESFDMKKVLYGNYAVSSIIVLTVFFATAIK